MRFLFSQQDDFFGKKLKNKFWPNPWEKVLLWLWRYVLFPPGPPYDPVLLISTPACWCKAASRSQKIFSETQKKKKKKTKKKKKKKKKKQKNPKKKKTNPELNLGTVLPMSHPPFFRLPGSVAYRLRQLPKNMGPFRWLLLFFSFLEFFFKFGLLRQPL